MKRSDDFGAAWSVRKNFNTDTVSARQFFPQIAVHQTSGKVVAPWYDTGNSPGAGAAFVYWGSGSGGVSSAVFYGDQAYANFGTSLAATAQLSQDHYLDIIVGAPGENNRQGAVYVFSCDSATVWYYTP